MALIPQTWLEIAMTTAIMIILRLPKGEAILVYDPGSDILSLLIGS